MSDTPTPSELARLVKRYASAEGHANIEDAKHQLWCLSEKIAAALSRLSQVEQDLKTAYQNADSLRADLGNERQRYGAAERAKAQVEQERDASDAVVYRLEVERGGPWTVEMMEARDAAVSRHKRSRQQRGTT